MWCVQMSSVKHTSLGAVTLAFRAHHHDPKTEECATDAERFSVTMAVVESARLFTGSTVAIRVRDKINALSANEWWDYEFRLHPTLLQFLHHHL